MIIFSKSYCGFRWAVVGAAVLCGGWLCGRVCRLVPWAVVWAASGGLLCGLLAGQQLGNRRAVVHRGLPDSTLLRACLLFTSLPAARLLLAAPCPLQHARQASAG